MGRPNHMTGTALSGVGLVGDGCGRSGFQNAQDICHIDVGCASGECGWDYSQFHPAPEAIFADVIAIAGQVAMNLADGSGLKSGCVHDDYLHFYDQNYNIPTKT